MTTSSKRCFHCFLPATASSTGAIRITPTPYAALSALRRRACCMSAAACRAGRRGAQRPVSDARRQRCRMAGCKADLLQSICARTPDGAPCCDWVGDSGAGHFVKMVHNGIEYGDLQLIGESYQFLRDGLGMDPVQCATVFRLVEQGRPRQLPSGDHGGNPENQGHRRIVSCRHDT